MIKAFILQITLNKVVTELKIHNISEFPFNYKFQVGPSSYKSKTFSLIYYFQLESSGMRSKMLKFAAVVLYTAILYIINYISYISPCLDSRQAV